MLYIENHASDSSANGMVRLVNNNVNIPEVASFSNSGLGTKYFSIQAGRYQAPDGTNLLPSYTFHDDIDTGMYSLANGVIGFTADGDTKMTISAATGVITLDSSITTLDAGSTVVEANALTVADGATTRVGWDDLNSRMLSQTDWLFEGSTVTMTSTLDAGTVTATSVAVTGNVSATTTFDVANGAAATPSLRFTNDTNTGVYRGSDEDHIGVSSGGVSVLIYDADDAAGSRWEFEDEIRASGISGDGSGKAVCIKADGNLGTCSDAVGGGGTCTCG
jgi:hypothetical protein